MGPRARAACVALTILTGGIGCGGGHTVFVDLVTDFVPGTDFDSVRATLEDASGAPVREETIAAAAGDPYAEGVRVAELHGVADGEYRMHVELLAAGVVVSERRVSVTVASTTALTVTIDRGCAQEICNGRDDDCDGEVDEEDDAALCDLAGATAAACTAGQCEITECSEGRLDCDLAAENGCEIDGATDDSSCGACGLECGAGLACERSFCRAGGVYAGDASWAAEDGRTAIADGGGWVVAEWTNLAYITLRGLDDALAERWTWSGMYAVGVGTLDFGGVVAEPDDEVAFLLQMRAVDAANATYHFSFGDIVVDHGQRATVIVRFGPDGAYIDRHTVSLVEPDTLVALVASGEDGYVIRSAHRYPESPGNAVPFVESRRADGSTRWLHTFFDGALSRSRQVDLHLTRAGAGGDVLVAAFDFQPGSIDFGDGAISVDERTAVVALYDADGSLRWKQVAEGTVVGTGVASDGAATYAIIAPESTSGLVETRARDGALVRSFELPLGELDDVAGLAVGEHGDVYVAGTIADPVDLGGGTRAPALDAMVLASYAPDGTYRFDRYFADPGSSRASGVVAGDGVLLHGTFTGALDFGGGVRAGDGTAVAILFED